MPNGKPLFITFSGSILFPASGIVQCQWEFNENSALWLELCISNGLSAAWSGQKRPRVCVVNVKDFDTGQPPVIAKIPPRMRVFVKMSQQVGHVLGVTTEAVAEEWRKQKNAKR
jgi:hypothetical protein